MLTNKKLAKMRACYFLLPAPGAEVANLLHDDLDILRKHIIASTTSEDARLAELRKKAAKMALDRAEKMS